MSKRRLQWLALIFVSSFSVGCGHPTSKEVVSPAPSAATPSVLPGSQGWWRDHVFYEIFVRSFADSNGDGIGDLRGLTAKLDYLNDGKPGGNDLGVDGIWLMPIHPSPSYHGYDVIDYRDVNPQYGSLADFDLLLAEAHRRGIRVILDFLLNHSSSESPWFKSARAGPGARYRDYYIWRQDAPPWGRPWDGAPVWHAMNGWFYYGLFWSGMPDLNLANPEVENEMLGAMRFWMRRGVDGFRVDAARHLFESADGKLVDQPESHALVKRLRQKLEAEFPRVLLVAEAWTDAYTVSDYYGKGDEFQLAFGFDTAAAIKASVRDGNADALGTAVQTAMDAYADPAFEAPFLSNHDQSRVMRDFGGDVRKARVAAAILHALPGTPFLYYGEEIGMQGGPKPRDEDKRTPMRWTAEAPQHGFTSASRSWYGETSEAPGVDVATQRADEGSLWSLYRRLIALRHATPALATGKPSRPAVTGGGRGVFALVRSSEQGRVLFVANVAGAPAGEIRVDAAPGAVTAEAGAAEGAGVATAQAPALVAASPASGAPVVLEAEGLVGAPRVDGGKIVLEGLGPQGFAFVSL